jgi:hypothetical protein
MDEGDEAEEKEGYSLRPAQISRPSFVSQMVQLATSGCPKREKEKRAKR